MLVPEAEDVLKWEGKMRLATARVLAQSFELKKKENWLHCGERTYRGRAGKQREEAILQTIQVKSDALLDKGPGRTHTKVETEGKEMEKVKSKELKLS